MDVRASQDNLIDILERMENFFQRLEVYTRVSPPREMRLLLIKKLFRKIPEEVDWKGRHRRCAQEVRQTDK